MYTGKTPQPSNWSSPHVREYWFRLVSLKSLATLLVIFSALFVAHVNKRAYSQGGIQPPDVVLDKAGASRIKDVFDSTGWTITTYPGNGRHQGDDYYALDIARACGQTAGQNLYAGISGKVYMRDYGDGVAYGKSLVVYDALSGFALRYGHMKEFASNLSDGMNVNAGAYVGKVGNTGQHAPTQCTIDPGAHLHLSLYKNVTSISSGNPVFQTDTSGGATSHAAEFCYLNHCPAPPAPVDLRATRVSSSQALIEWNFPHYADGFALERSTGTGGSFSWIANLGMNDRSYTNSNLSGSTTYCYRVKAYRGINDSSYSNVSCASPLATSPTPTPTPSPGSSPTPTPSPTASPGCKSGGDAPYNVTATALSSTRVQITWQYQWPSLSDDPPEWIEVQRFNPGGGWDTYVGSNAYNSTQLVDSFATAGTRYKYRARAVWGYTNQRCSSYSESDWVTTPSCRYQLSSVGTTSFGVNGGTGRVTLTAPPRCDWRAASNDPTWIGISPSSGTGSYTLDYWVNANVSPGSRSGSFAIADQTVRITQPGSNTFNVLRFDPSSTFYNVFSGNWHVGDFNKDGNADLIHLTDSDYTHPWLSRGNGKFGVDMFRPWAGYNIRSGTWLPGDVDGDGRTDLVHVTDSNFLNVWISRGNGKFVVNAFKHHETYSNKSGTWMNGDLNGDGRMDLIHLLPAHYMNSWLSRGDGTFEVKEFYPPGGRYSVGSGSYLAADFNGDRKTDLVHFVNNDYVHIWLSNGDGSFKVLDKYAPWPGYHFGRATSWHAGDFNGDGFTDLIHIVGGDYVHTWISKGDGKFSVGFFRPAPGYHSGWGRWLTGDLDADGKTDLVHLVPSDYVHPWLSKGDGTFAVSRFTPTPGYNVNSGWWVTGDLNGDGKTDLVHLTQSSYVHPWISGADQSTYTYILATPQAAQCPGCPISPSVIVWVNTPSGLYRCKGMKLYGRTKQGEYMTQKQAQDRGYRKAYGGICR